MLFGELNQTMFLLLSAACIGLVGGLSESTRTAQVLADYQHSKQGNWQVLFYGWPSMGYYSIASLPYLEPQIIGTEAIHPWGSPENPLPSAENVIFVFLPQHAADLDGALRQYPGGHERDIVDPTMGQLFTLYELSPYRQSPWLSIPSHPTLEFL